MGSTQLFLVICTGVAGSCNARFRTILLHLFLHNVYEIERSEVVDCMSEN